MESSQLISIPLLPTEEKSVTKTVFFNRKSLDIRKKKLKPIVYQIYLCTYCLPSEIISETPQNLVLSELGAWCALIVRQPQDMFNAEKDTQTTYMLSGVEESNSHIEIRLNGVKESLNWITANLEKNQYSSVETTFVSNDVFVVNILREWLPKWHKNDFKLGPKGSGDDIRPNLDLLRSISEISTNIKLVVKWQAEKSYEMEQLRNKIDNILDTHLKNISKLPSNELVKRIDGSSIHEAVPPASSS